jgi:hypothetical protein
MEGSSEELESIMDKHGVEPLEALWDHEPPKLSKTPNITSNKHEWVHIEESKEAYGDKGMMIEERNEKQEKWRAFTYECRKCGSRIIVPASESDLSVYGTPTCNECLVSNVMDE